MIKFLAFSKAKEWIDWEIEVLFGVVEISGEEVELSF
jgi:hypothetical protein